MIEAWVKDLAERLEKAGIQEPARALERVAASYDGQRLHALLLGRFSAGKSTLINAFLGYPVLPGGLAPTTGVICQVSYGTPGALVRFKDGRVETFPGPEALQPYLALDPQTPSTTARLSSIDRVEVTLPLPLLQNGLEIVDSPGLDETSERSGVASQGLERADIVLFVLAADQLMGEVERRFLVDEVLPRSPGALALVVNFWDRIAEEDRPSLLQRLKVVTAEIQERAAPNLPIAHFTLSAARAVRSRWRPTAGNPGPSGIEELEAWLKQQAASGEEVRSHALQGRLRYTLRRAEQSLRRERAAMAAALREEERAASEARNAVARSEEAAARTTDLLQSARASLLHSLSMRVSSGEGSLRAEIQRRLQKDPYDPLNTLHQEIRTWWTALLAAVQMDAGAALVRLVNTMEEGGIHLSPEDLPSLKIDLAPPLPDFIPVADSTAPMKDTIAGMLGSVSKSAADSAAAWMKKASNYAAGLAPRTRHLAQAVTEKLEAAVAMAAYQGRQQVQEWTEGLSQKVDSLVARRREDAAADRAAREQAVRDTRARIPELDALQEEIRERMGDD